jgi:hypothetical protein
MRVLMLAAVVCFAVALLGQISVLAGVDVLAWALAGWLAWSGDVALGGYVFATPRRGAPPA